MVDVFEAIATKELVVGTGSRLSTPSTAADDLVIYAGGGAAGGLTIESTSQGHITFADAASSVAGRIVYFHDSGNKLSFYIETVDSCDINSDGIHFKEATSKTPTVNLSGAIFISGGGLWYKGFAGTYKELAVT